MNNILVIQTAYLGDVILTTPLILGLKNDFPEINIDVLSIPVGKPIWENNPSINQVIVYDKKGKNKGIRSLLKFIHTIRKNKYDWVISPHRSLRSGLIAYFSGAVKRTSFDKSVLSRFFYNDIKPYKQIHEVDRNLSLIDREKKIIRPNIFPTADEMDRVDEFLKKQIKGGAHVVIAPGSVWATKRWPVEKYAELTKALLERNIAVSIIGGNEDLYLSDLVSFKSELFQNFISKLNIRESCYLIQKAHCLVTNDSAPLHLGSAAGTPTIAIFGSTIPEFGFGPYGNDKSVVIDGGELYCRPCGIHGKRECPEGHFRCMTDIDINVVIEKVMAIVAK